jgi:hypothetical protein
MADKQAVRCVRQCFDSDLAILYYPGDIADIDPERPIAKYFEGWKPGTKVYYKKWVGDKRRGRFDIGLRVVEEEAPKGPQPRTLDDFTVKELREEAKKYPELKLPTHIKRENLVLLIREASARKGLESAVVPEADAAEEEGSGD